MESMVSNAANFSPQYILNLGQLDILSHFDSFGDIPGQGEIVLDRKVLWTLKSNLVLFWMSSVVLYKIYTRGKWSEMPMDIIRQLSVTFPDCSELSVLDTVTVVTVLTYNFPTGEKQHGSLVRFFVEQDEKILFCGVYFVSSFSYQIIIIWSFKNLQAEERRFVGKIFSVSLASLNRIPSLIFSRLLNFSFSINVQRQNFVNFFCSVMLVCGFASLWYQCFCCGVIDLPTV